MTRVNVTISGGKAYHSTSVLLAHNSKRTKQSVLAEKLEAMMARV
jgi:hypothetical protein